MIWLSLYLAVGLLHAVALALIVTQLTKVSGRYPDVDAAGRNLEDAVAKLPGGMITALVAVTLAWPMWIVAYVRGRR